MLRRDNMIRHKLEVDADCLERNGVSYKDQLLDALEKNLNGKYYNYLVVRVLWKR